MVRVMRRLLLTVVLSLVASLIPTLVTTPARANPAMDGTWRVAVMKKGTEKTSLSKKDYLLVLVFDHQAKTWSATVRSEKGEDDEGKAGKSEPRKRAGTYQTKGDKVVLTDDATDESHELKVFVQGRQMVLIPTQEPDLRLIALKVE